MSTEPTAPAAQVDGVVIGTVYRTPWEPHGLFRVLEIEPQGNGFAPTAFGVFVGDHPHGYKDGDLGRYFVSELAGRESMAMNDRRRHQGKPPASGERTNK